MDSNGPIIAKLIGGPLHGKKMIVPQLSLEIRCQTFSPPSISYLNSDTSPNDPSFFSNTKDHRYRLTKVSDEGIRYYLYSELDASKSKTLRKVYMESEYKKYLNNVI